MIQSAILLNDRVIRDRLKRTKGNRIDLTLQKIADPALLAPTVEDLFLTALSRPPSPAESTLAVALLRENPEESLPDLLWVLLNRLDFLFY